MTSKITNAAVAGALLALVATCASEPGAKLCANGMYCPANMFCAAVQQVCLTSTCGNGVVDPGEECDDGNIIGGDGCSADCKSTEVCGNGIRDVGEACDDGNLVNGDGCSGTSVTVGSRKS